MPEQPEPMTPARLAEIDRRYGAGGGYNGAPTKRDLRLVIMELVDEVRRARRNEAVLAEALADYEPAPGRHAPAASMSVFTLKIAQKRDALAKLEEACREVEQLRAQLKQARAEADPDTAAIRDLLNANIFTLGDQLGEILDRWQDRIDELGWTAEEDMPEELDQCRMVTVETADGDGEPITIRVRGEQEMSAEGREALSQIIAATERRLATDTGRSDHEGS